MADKKERNRLKRKRKQEALRKAKSQSPYKKLGGPGEWLGIYINPNWRSAGIAHLACFKRVPGLGIVQALFLVDIWFMGLKDCAGRFESTLEEIESVVLPRMRERFGTADRIDLDLARRLVMGGVKYGLENGVRPPARYERWISILGEWNGEIDRTLFGGPDGKPCFVGEIEQLQGRLLRDDLTFEPEEDDEDSSDDEEELETGWSDSAQALAGMKPEMRQLTELLVSGVTTFADELVEEAKQWCAQTGTEPEAAMQMAARSTVMICALTLMGGEEIEGSESEFEQLGEVALSLLGIRPNWDELGVAVAQFAEFAEAYGTQRMEEGLTRHVLSRMGTSPAEPQPPTT